MKLFFSKNCTMFKVKDNDYCNIYYEEKTDQLSNQLLKINFQKINSEKDSKILKSFGIFPDVSNAISFHSNNEMYVTIAFNITNNQNQKIKFYNGKEYILINNNYYEGVISNYKKLRISVETINNDTIIYYNSLDIVFYDCSKNKIKEYNNTDKNIIEVDNIYFWGRGTYGDGNEKTYHSSEKNFINPKINSVCLKLDNINKINETNENSICTINKYCYVLNIHNITLPSNFNFSLFFQSDNCANNLIRITAEEDFNSDVNISNLIDVNIKNISKNLYFYTNIVKKPVYFIYVNTNYLHFVRDNLPYLFHYIELKKNIPDIKLILLPFKETHSPFVYDFLNSLNISKDDLYCLNNKDKENTLFKETYTGHFTDFLRDKFYIDCIREEIFNKIYYKYSLKNIINKKRRVYISRRIRNNMGNNVGQNNYANRYVHNESELVDLFKQYNFEEIWSEDLTLQHKIQLFQECEHIFFQHSAFTVNIQFIKNTNIHILVCGYGTDENDPSVKHAIKYNKNNVHIIIDIYKILNVVSKKDVRNNGIIDLIRVKQILDKL